MKANRKGFTITELVIVIVVIAILAAVLIPTFASLIKKANISADTQMAKNLNTALTMYEASGNKVDDFSEALDAMREAGYLLANMNPTADGCYLAWEKETNQVLLVELSDNSHKVLYHAKENYGEPDDSWYFAVKDQATADAIKAVLANVNTELTILDTTALNTEINGDGEKTVYIDGSINADDNNVVKLDNANANTTIDLGNSVVSGGSTNASLEAIPFQVEAGTLNLVGGTVSASAAFIDSDGDLCYGAVWAEGGVVNVDSTTFDCPDGEILLAYCGATGAVNNATINTHASAINVGSNSVVTVENCTINVFCEAIWVSSSGGYNDTKVTVKSGTYSGTGNTLAMHGGTLVIEGGTFTSTNPNLFRFYAADSTLVIKGGTFNGKTFDANTDPAVIKGMFSTGTTNYSNLSIVWANDAWTITN
ncbi:MAG: prepilin-type N-terminal cleavage/methylation domain-containing protein [Oscillospiraceae bacterium]|nr:prepilin-type N-terminal cleavage/methylation domain-containing protein [Oscillospiraceae bacterium]